MNLQLRKNKKMIFKKKKKKFKSIINAIFGKIMVNETKHRDIKFVLEISKIVMYDLWHDYVKPMDGEGSY